MVSGVGVAAYSSSISCWYFSAMGLRRNFRVGVSSSPPGSQIAGRMRKRLICSTRERLVLAVRMPAVGVDRFGCLFWVVAVAAHDGGAAGEDFAVVGELDLDLGDDRANGADAVAAGGVRSGQSAGFGHPPQFVDGDSEAPEVVQG